MIAGPLILAVAIGGALGAAYYLLLWVSVRDLTQGAPGWLFVGGALARAALVIAALALFAATARPLSELALALVGFLLVRQAATRIVKNGEGDLNGD